MKRSYYRVIRMQGRIKLAIIFFAALLVITGSVILIASIFQQPEAQEVQNQ